MIIPPPRALRLCFILQLHFFYFEVSYPEYSSTSKYCTLFIRTESPEARRSRMEDASVTSLEAVEVVENLEHIFKALKKAGVSQGELASFSSAVQRGVEPRFLRSSSAPKSRRGTEGGDLNGEVLWDGVVERLERGKHGFAATWKRRFVQLRRGELICFAGPEPPMDNHAVTILPLALQTTTIEILNEVMSRRLGRPNALSVSTQKGR